MTGHDETFEQSSRIDRRAGIEQGRHHAASGIDHALRQAGWAPMMTAWLLATPLIAAVALPEPSSAALLLAGVIASAAAIALALSMVAIIGARRLLRNGAVRETPGDAGATTIGAFDIVTPTSILFGLAATMTLIFAVLIVVQGQVLPVFIFAGVLAATALALFASLPAFQRLRHVAAT